MAKRKNPAELVIFSNPTAAPRRAKIKATRDRASRIRAARLSNSGTANHKKNCACPFCKRARKNPTTRTSTSTGGATGGAVTITTSGSSRTETSTATGAGAGKGAGKGKGGGAAGERPSRIHITVNSTGKSGHAIDRSGARLKGRNPSDTEQAVKLFENFSGRNAQEVIAAQRSSAMRLDYAALGKLVALGFDDEGMTDDQLRLHWDDCPHLPFEGNGVMLASAPGGADKKARQLYFIDGNQNLDAALADFDGLDTGKDLIDLGDVFFVVYWRTTNLKRK